MYTLADARRQIDNAVGIGRQHRLTKTVQNKSLTPQISNTQTPKHIHASENHAIQISERYKHQLSVNKYEKDECQIGKSIII